MPEKTVTDQISALRTRARYLRLQSYMILFLIAGIIGAGSYIFYFSIQLDESAVASAAEDLKMVRDDASNEAEAIRNILTQRQITYDSASEIVSLAIGRVEKVADDLESGVFDLQNKIRNIEESISGASAIDLDQVRSMLDEKLALASKELLDVSREVETGISELWLESAHGYLAYDNCEVRDDFYDPGNKQMLTCYPPYISNFDEVFENCSVSPGVSLRGDHRNIRCDEAAWVRLELSSRLSDFRKPIDLFSELQKEIGELSADEISFQLDLSGDFDLYRADILSVTSALRSLNEEAKLEEPNLNTSIIGQLTDVAAQLDAAANSMSSVYSVRTGDGAVYYWMEKLSQRVMVVLLMIFLVQIFVNLFRYGTRLASFYDGRADALSLIADSGVSVTSAEFHSMVLSLAPDGLDFGKSAKSPIDSAVELSRQIITVGRAQK
jgi:hypothetical protein